MHILSEIFSGRYFKIPANQRGYSWSAKHYKDIISDLRLAGSNAHYLGPIIVSRSPLADFQDEDLITTVEFILEDGQQRLTTIYMLASEIRKRLVAINDGNPCIDAMELERLLFYNHKGRKLKIQNSNTLLHDYFSYIIQDTPAPPADKSPPMARLDEVVGEIRSGLQNYTRQQLIRLKNMITHKAKFIWVDLAADGVDRYLAFDAINSRGLALSEFDKIKNFAILLDTKRGLGLQAEKSWHDSLINLEKMKVSGRSDEAAFITELYSAFFGEKLSQSQIHDRFVKRHQPLLTTQNSDLENNLKLFVGSWSSFCKSWSYIATRSRNLVPAGEFTPMSLKWLACLDRMELPGITRILLAAAHNRYDQEDFERVVRACEIFTFRMYAIRRYRKDKYSKIINDLAHSILRENASPMSVLQRFCQILGQNANLQDCVSELTDGKPKYYYDPTIKGWPHCYYFLYEYELYCSPNGGTQVDWASDKTARENTIEHILPQSHRDHGWWQSHWSDANDANKYKHRLGNLVLTLGNSELGRKSITDKLDLENAYCYNYHQATNSEKRIHIFTDGSQWLPENVLAREYEMIKFAINRWSIPCCDDLNEIMLDGEYLKYPDEFSPLSVEDQDCVSCDAVSIIEEDDVNNPEEEMQI